MMVNGVIGCGPQLGYPEPAPMKTTCCPPDQKGLWNEWRAWSACSATACGGCQKRSRKRTCASAAFGCPCEGPESEDGFCSQQVCGAAPECCAPFAKTLNARKDAICLQDGTMPPCDPNGVWSEWSSVACSDTCGLCGVMQRTRKCLSEDSGCPCKGASAEGTELCGEELCKHPRLPCCAGFKKGIVNRRIVCMK
uniref:Disintegrin domain-containing protein n=1 Tax=Steinernema glaseri TaxID=37863 RepID=A0A1I7YB72_9BILA